MKICNIRGGGFCACRTDQGALNDDQEPVLALYDVAVVAKRRSTLTETEKYNFYCNHFSPGVDFKFPREHSRSFQHQYLRRYKRLVYSQQQNGGFCLPCVLFARNTLDARKGKGTFVDREFTNFKKAYDICNAHADCQYHQDAVVACDAFIDRMSGREESVVVQLSRGLREAIQKNREKLHSIVETIVLCGCQNIALRGHHDSSTDTEGIESGERNHGNFWALLNFRISAGDNVLRDHLRTAPRNATYTSPDIQNLIINILGDQIRDKILDKVRNSLSYTLIADEVTDCSNKEQLCIVLRYVELESNSIKEDLVTFLECDSGVTGAALADKMLSFVSKHPTHIQLCIKTLHSSIVACFESISAEGASLWSPDSVTDASTLLLAITSTEFISALVITHECLQYLRGLTTSLQEEAKDIVQAVSEINTLMLSLKQVRERVNFYHDKWFGIILEMCMGVGTTPSVPRICGRQRHRASIPAASPSEYYRRTITIPILDHLLTELERRFSTLQKTALQGLYLVPSVLVTEDVEKVTTVVTKVGEQYTVDLPNASSLGSEVHNWHTKWINGGENNGKSSLPTTLSSTLPLLPKH